MRTALRVGLIGGLLLALAAGLFWTQRERILNRLASTIEARLADHLGASVDIGRLRFELVPLALVAEDITVRSPSTALSVPPLTVGRITAKPSLISLLTETQVIRTLRIERPRVEVVSGADGASNLPAIVSSAPAADHRAPRVVVRRIEIRDAEITYRGSRGAVTIADADLLVLPDLLMRHVTAELTAARGALTIGERSVALGATRIQAAFENGRLTLNAVSIEGPGLEATGNGKLVFDPTPDVDLEVSASIDLESWAGMFVPGHTVGGRVAVRAQAKGPLSKPIVEGQVVAKALVYDDIPIGDVTADLRFADDHVAATHLVGTVLGGEVRGTAEIDVTTTWPSWSIALTTARVRPQALVRYLAPTAAGAPPFEVSGPLTLRGRGRAITAMDGDGRLALVRRDGSSEPAGTNPSAVRALLALITTGDVPWTIRGGILSVQDGVVASDTGRLTVSGTLSSQGEADLTLALSEQAASAVAAALRMPFAIGGRAGFVGRLTGPLVAPRVEGRASVRDLTLRGQPAGDVATTLRYADHTLAVGDTTWRKDDARYEADGTLTWPGDHTVGFDLTARLHAGQVHDVLPIAFHQLPIDAVVDGTFTFRGSPAEFQIVGELDVADGSIYGQSFDSGSVGMTFDRRRVVFTHVTLRRGESQVNGRGTILYHGDFEAEFDAPRLHLQTIDLFGLNTLPLSGSVAATLTTRGTFDRPEMHGVVKIGHIEGAGQPLGGGRVTVDVADRLVRLAATLDDQHTQLDGTLRWEPGFPVSAVLTVADGSLVPLIRPWLPQVLKNMTAMVSGRVTLDGPLTAPLHWRMDSRLSRLSADVGEFLVENHGDLVVSLDAGRVTIGAFNLRGTDTTLNVSGSVDLFKEYRLFIVGEADLHLARLVTPTISAGQGKTYLVLKISDRWDSPKIQGGVTVQDARLKIRNLPQSITIDSMGLFFNERQILLESFEGGFGKGRVSATGQIQLKGFRPERFGYLIDLAGIEYPLTEHLTPTLSGQLIFQGTPDAQSLRGELTVDRAIYAARIDVQERLLELRRRAEQPDLDTTGAAALTHRVSLNVHFSGKDQIGIQNNLARIPLEVDLFLRGTADRPYLIGRIEAREGQINFRSNEFTVQSATVDFIDPTRIRPHIDLRATTTVRTRSSAQTYHVTLQLTGTLERFDLELTSDPSLNETDILALLTLGKTTEEVSQSEAGFSRDEAAAIAFQALLDEGINRVPGVERIVDCLQIDPYRDLNANTSTPQLSVCKQLLEDRLTVNYATTLDSTGRQVVRVEYALAGNVFLIGQQDDRGFGGDLRFRFEFR